MEPLTKLIKSAFRSTSKPTDANKSAITETKHGNGMIPSDSINVVLFGEAGVGKSSVVNLIARRNIAKVSSDVEGCTMESTRHDIEFDGMKFAIFDTVGLEQPRMDVNGYLKAIEKLYELITRLNYAGGVHLLLFCMRGGKISATTQSNYRLFSETLRIPGVPIAIVFTGLEQEMRMEGWWERNKVHIEGYGIESDGHACVTTIREESLKYAESQRTIRELLKTCAHRSTASSPDPLWFAKCAKNMEGFITQGKSPERRKVSDVLVKRCKLDRQAANTIVDMIEQGNLDTQAASPRVVEEVSLPNSEVLAFHRQEAEGSRRSQNGVVPRFSNASFLGLNTESNAFERQKTKHVNEYVVAPSSVGANGTAVAVPVRETPKPSDDPSSSDSALRTIASPINRSSKQLGGESILDSTIRTISSRSVKEDTRPSSGGPNPHPARVTPSHSIREGIRRSKEEVITGGISRAIPPPSVKESARSTREELVLGGASSAFPPPSTREGIRPKEALIPESAGRATICPSVRESTKSTKEKLVLDGAGGALPSRSVGEGIRTKEAAALNRAGRATPSANVKESIGPPRRELYVDTVPGSIPYSIGETQAAVRPNWVASSSAGANKWPAVSSTGRSSGQMKKVPNPDSSWSATGPREVSGQFKRGSNLEVVSQAGARVGAGGSAAQPRNPGTSSVIQAVLLPPGRGGSTGQESITSSTTRTISSRSVREDASPYAIRDTPSYSVKKGIKQPKEDLIPSGASRAVPSPNVMEGVRPSRGEPHAPYTDIGGTAIQPKWVPSPVGADQWSAVSSAGGSPGQTKKVPNPDSRASKRSVPPPEASRQFQRVSNLEVASQLAVGGSTGRPRNVSADVLQPLSADQVAAQRYAGRGGSTARG